MKEFFASMDTSLQLYWYIAIGASLIFIVQTIMTFIGADTDTGVDADFDGNLDGVDGAFQLFSLRNLVNFLLGLGWTGVSLYGSISNKIILGIVSVLVGMLFVAIFFFIMRALMKLAEDNSFDIEKTIGLTADVYTNIPPKKQGKGKVFVSLKGTTHELEAITTNDDMLKAGQLVKIVGLEGNVLVVSLL